MLIQAFISGIILVLSALITYIITLLIDKNKDNSSE